MSSCSSPAPISQAEQELQQVKVTEVMLNQINQLWWTNAVIWVCFLLWFLQDKVVRVCRFILLVLIQLRVLCVAGDTFFFNFLWRSQDDRRRIGTPTARARVWSHLICWHLAFPILALPIFPLWPLCLAGPHGVWLGQACTDSPRSCIPTARRGQTSSATTQTETHQLHTAGEQAQET